MRLAGRRKEGTITGCRLSPGCRATSFQISDTVL